MNELDQDTTCLVVWFTLRYVNVAGASCIAAMLRCLGSDATDWPLSGLGCLMGCCALLSVATGCEGLSVRGRVLSTDIH